MIVRRLPSSFRESVERQLAERGDPPIGPHPSRIIDELVKNRLAPLMKSERFRKSGPNFWRDSDEWIDVLNVQKSQWNDAWSASFYVNLGVYWKSFHRDQGSEYRSKFPHEYDCTVFSRVLEPKSNAWIVEPDSDVDEIGRVLTKAVGEALSWFGEMHSHDGTLNYLRTQGIEERFEQWVKAIQPN